MANSASASSFLGIQVPVSNPSVYPSTRPRKQNCTVIRANHHQFQYSASAFQRLGLHEGASQHEIKTAYRKLALQFHPDVCKDESCASRFLQITDAYQTIMNCLQGHGDSYNSIIDSEQESMMGVNDDSWEEWEEWMGWEGASGSLDYSSHINHTL